MTSTKPYLIRALYEWCVDQGFTPHIQVLVGPGARVPKDFVRDGQIVFNIGMDATHQLEMLNDEVTFQARFNGKAFPVRVPMNSIMSIYARENGQGMAFDVTEADLLEEEVATSEVEVEAADRTDMIADEAVSSESPPEPPPAGTRPALRRVK